MITNIRIRNFKGLENAEFQLGAEPVVLVGPNSCGKTSILQALTMWHHGVREWCQRYDHRKKHGNDKQPRGVPNPLKNFSALVAPDARMIWRGQDIATRAGKVKIGIDVSGETGGEPWAIWTDFTHHGQNNIYCFPSAEGVLPGESPANVAKRWQRFLPPLAFLQPMSGMSEEEDVFGEIGSIDDRLGKGKTADVLRNICYQLMPPQGSISPEQWNSKRETWDKMAKIIASKFPGITLNPPQKDPRGKIRLTYTEGDKDYDLSCGGRGFHQTLLLLAFLFWNPGAVVLLDEPDAHLEVVRQRQNFSMYSDIAAELGSQLLIASHSEAVMNEAAARGKIIQVVHGGTSPLTSPKKVGKFRSILTDIEWDKVVAAKTKGHVLFVEGTTDIDFLAEFARMLFGTRGEAAAQKIKNAYAEPVGNNVKRAVDLFQGLQNVIPGLPNYALFDGDARDKTRGDNVQKARGTGFQLYCWKRREIENYLLLPDVLYRYAEMQDNSEKKESALSLSKHRFRSMQKAVKKNTEDVPLGNPADDFWRNHPMSKHIGKILADYHADVRGEQPLWHSRMYSLVEYMRPEEMASEVREEIREQILAILAVIAPDFDPEQPHPQPQDHE